MMMQRLLLLVGVSLPPAFGQMTYEDWNCYSASLVDNGDGTATGTCAGGRTHGFTTSTQILISGLTGDWAGANTPYVIAMAGLTSPIALSSSANTFQVNDTHRLCMSATQSKYQGQIQIATQTDVVEDVVVTAIGANNVLTVTRGQNGTTAISHHTGTGTSEALIVNYRSAAANGYWQITAVPSPTTFKIAYNCGSDAGHPGTPCAAFTGTTEIQRQDLVAVGGGGQTVVQEDQGAESWGLYSTIDAGGYHHIVPFCSNQSNIAACAPGLLMPEQQKNYGNHTAISSVVVDNTTNCNGTHCAVVNLTSGWASSSNTIQQLSNLAVGSFVLLRGVNEVNPGDLNNAFTVLADTTSGSTITSVTVASNAAPNTYSATGGCPPSSSGSGCLWIPFAARTYIIFNGYPAGSVMNPATQALWVNAKDPSDFSSSMNRMCTYMTPGSTSTKPWPETGIGETFQWGTYIQPASGLGTGHWYHNLQFDSEAGQPMLYCWTRHVTQSVGLFGVDWPDDDSYNSYQTGSPGISPQNGQHMLAGLQDLYINGDWRIGSETLSPVIWSTASGEPDELIDTRGLYYSAANSTYNLYLTLPKGIGLNGGASGSTKNVSYQVRYSTSGSLKTAGFSTGLCFSTGTTTCGSTDTVNSTGSSYNSQRFISPGTHPAPSPTLWFAVMPTAVPIISTSGAGQNPSYLTTIYDLGLAQGDHISTDGSSVLPTALQNLSYQAITSYVPRQLYFLETPESGYTAAGPLRDYVCTGSSCTVNLNVSPTVVPGMVASVFGTASGGPWGGNSILYYFYQITSVNSGCETGATSCFSFNSTATAGTYNTDNSSGNRLSVEILPAYGVAVTGNGSYNAGGAINAGGNIFSAENNKGFAELAFTPPSASCTITNLSLPAARNGVAYSQNVATSGCAAPTFSISAGTLPAWASLSVSTGVISGTPSGSTPATSTFTVAISDANGSPSQQLSITDITPPAITTTSPLPTGTQGSSYGPLQFSATGDANGTCSGCSWSATGLPAGMTFSSSGSLGGTPSVSGTFTINVTATNNTGSGVAGPTGFSITINTASAGAAGGTTVSGAVPLSGNSTVH